MKTNAAIPSLLNILKSGSPSAASEAVRGLLSLDIEDAAFGIIENYHHLSSGVRDELVGYSQRFATSLSRLVRAPNPQVRFNCIEFMRHSQNQALAPILGLCAGDESPEIACEAVSAIENQLGDFLSKRGAPVEGKTSEALAVCRQVSDSLNVDHAEFAEMRGLLIALGHAVENLHLHKRGDVLDMLVRLGKRGDAVLLAELRQALGRGRARDLIIAEMAERPRAATLMLLLSMFESGSATLRRIAGELLKGCGDGGHREALLIESLKARGPEGTCAILRSSRNIPWLAEINGSLGKLGDEMLLAWVAELDSMDIDLARKIELLRRCLLTESEPVVAKVFEVIGRHYGPLVRPILLENATSERECVRFHALAALTRHQFDGKFKLLKGELSSESIRIRSLAAKSLAHENFARFVKDFDALSEEGRFAAAESVRKIDPGMVDKLATLLAAFGVDERLRALRIIRYTGMTPRLEAAVLAMVTAEDRRVRAAVPLALGTSQSPDAARAVLRLLGDTDLRVKSNAIEAIESMGNEVFQKALIPLLRAHDSRTRANAAKAMYMLGSKLAFQILESMARNKDFRQRLSGVWALANIKEPETLSLAYEIAKYEEDPAVQRRMLNIVDAADDVLRAEKFGKRPTTRMPRAA